MIEKDVKKLLKDEFGFIEVDYNQTSKTIITFLSTIIREKMDEIRDLKEQIHFLEVDKKNNKIMIDDLQSEKEDLKSRLKDRDNY